MKKPAVVLCVFIILCSLTSCRAADESVFKNMPAAGATSASNQQQSNSSGDPSKAPNSNDSPSSATNISENSSITTNISDDKGSPDLNSTPDDGSLGASLFDYTAIKIDTTKSLDTEIKNCGIYLDIYSDLIILGEIKNSSSLYKTNVEITFDFYNSKGKILDSQKVKTTADYILPGKSFPFNYIYDKKSKYIDLSSIKVGVNYKNYNKSFGGFPVAARKNFYYIDDMMIINGNVSNIGNSDIEDLKLTGIFYNSINKVVFLKECYLARDKLYTGQAEDFVLKILLDEYTPQFTHFGFETSFRDTLKV